MEGKLTARRACLSFSCSVRILCCSALSARRFSCTFMPTDAHIKNCFPGGCVAPVNPAFLTRLTILLTRATSSASSFFLWMKWASIRDCSSVRSFSWRFLWMSCNYTHIHTHIMRTFKNLLNPNQVWNHFWYSGLDLLTSKSTFSPSGIFGTDKGGAKALQT